MFFDLLELGDFTEAHRRLRVMQRIVALDPDNESHRNTYLRLFCEYNRRVAAVEKVAATG
jgi:hypothetical protein